MVNYNEMRISGFREIKIYINDAFSFGLRHAVLWAYFLVVVLLCGGCGLWETFMLTNMSNRLMACNTIALSVASAACVDLLFSRKNRPLRALGLVVGGVIMVVHILSLVFRNISWASGIFAVFAWGFAHLTWLVVNAHNPNLFDVDPQDSSGGASDGALSGKGNYQGLKVD